MAATQRAVSLLDSVRRTSIRDRHPADPHRYWVNATSVGMTKDGEKPFVWTRKDAFNMPCMIDTGSTLSYIREDLVVAIGQQFNAWVEGTSTYRVDCAWREKKGTVDFGFNKGRAVINVSYRDFIWEMFSGQCYLGVQPADVGATNYVLGNTFIRAAYCRCPLLFPSWGVADVNQWCLTSSRM